MNKEELKEPKLIWKWTTAEAPKLEKVTQADVGRWNRNDVEGESFSNGYEEGFQKGKLEQKKKELKKWRKFKKDFCSYRSCDACMVNLEEIDKIIKQLQKEIGGMK